MSTRYPGEDRKRMACEGKQSFPTFALAKQTAKRKRPEVPK